MNPNIPDFEQRPESPEDWAHPVVDRVASVLEAAESEELSLKERIQPFGTPEDIEHTLKLMSNDVEVASAYQVRGGDFVVNGFSFDFPTDGGSGDSNYNSIKFDIDRDGSVSAFFTVSPEDYERLLAPSQLATPIMRAVDNSLDGLLTAWVTNSEKFGFQILDNDAEPFSEEMAEVHLKLLAAILGVRERPQE